MLNASLICAACPGEYEISSGDGPLPMAIFELLEYIVNEVSELLVSCGCPSLIMILVSVAQRQPTSLTLLEAECFVLMTPVTVSTVNVGVSIALDDVISISLIADHGLMLTLFTDVIVHDIQSLISKATQVSCFQVLALERVISSTSLEFNCWILTASLA